MILFFDTETTGVIKPKKPIPNLVQLGAILTDYSFNTISSVDLTVYPNGWDIPEGAANVHGIPTEKAERTGLSLPTVVNVFSELAEVADLFVCHNAAYDTAIMRNACAMVGLPDPFGSKQCMCTMLAGTPVLKIPKDGGYKYPKLQELHFHFFNENFEDEHNAMVDIQATIRVFPKLLEFHGVVLGTNS